MLNNHSHFSLTYGTLSPREMHQWAQDHQLPFMAITDINNTAACIEFVRLAQEEAESPERPVKPILGVDFRRGVEQYYVALARNNSGFREINEQLSHILMEDAELEERAPEFEDVYVIYPWSKAPKGPLRENEYIGIKPSELNRLRFSSLAHRREKLVLLHTNSFRHKRDFNTHRLLRAIGDNVLLSKLDAQRQASLDDLYRSPQELQGLCADFPELYQNSLRLLESCSIDFTFKDYRNTQNQKVWSASGQASDDREKIRQLCRDGLRYRFGDADRPDVLQRMEAELEVLEKRGFYSYFLINWDIVRYARRNNYFYVGRGSGANSLIAYLLRITDVDPIELDLYFERFMNMYRQQPPDFDIDFSWRDREDVTRYIFERYPKAALLGSHTTFQHRAVVRELGKVLGLPARDIDALSHPRFMPKQMDDMQRLVLKYGKRIADFPHHMTIHSSGILIPEKDIQHFGSTFLPPKGFPTTQFNMHSAEDVGLYKFDILGQRGLGKIKDAVSLVRQNQPQAADFDIHHTRPLFEDERIKALLREGKTMACFYVESPAMRGLLRKLRGDTYRSLVAASSIIRPGVSKSGMMSEYIKRFRRPETRQYIHPKLAEILSETFGVMVYQEDVLKVAHYFAGLTLEEADVLRRGMSWKFKERNLFHTIKSKFFSNCAAFGYPDEVAQQVWTQIESFGNFAFAKGHSASYAVESYQSLFLKAYYPLEYMVATVNNGGGFYRTETYLNEARLHGGIIEAPCINRSSVETLIQGKHIYLGFAFMKELEERCFTQILQEREAHGPFSSLEDFLDRVEISLQQLLLLIRIRAFRTIEPDKQALLWKAHFLLNGQKKSAPIADLFRTEPKEVRLPKLEKGQNDDAFDEIELLGFPLSSPFKLVKKLPIHCIKARELEQHLGKEVEMCGYLIHVKNLNTRSDQPKHMQFGCFLDEDGDFIDTVHFPTMAAQYPFQGKGVYHLRGKVVEDFDFISLEMHSMERLASLNFMGN